MTSKIYFVRHQAAGFLTQFPFAEYPSDEQVAAVEEICLQTHGELHPKTKEAYWTKVVDFDVLGAKDVPEVPDPGDGHTENVVPAGQYGASGTIVVTNPKPVRDVQSIGADDVGSLDSIFKVPRK